ncbi:MAG: N-acetylmuramoyl-L-alanine amidase [Bacteroidota bacterium]
MNRFLWLLIALWLSVPALSQTSCAPAFTFKTIVIDAGHGGKDPGACGSKTKEKDITLALALKLGGYIEQNIKNVKVIYTRSTDEFIELYQRATIANNAKADLYISIHCNSNPKPNPHGAETFVMGTNKTQANLEVAKKENASILLEDNYIAKYDGFDPNSPEANIIFSLYQNAYLEQSLNLASRIQKEIKTRVGRVDRGVKQAGFLVLYKTTMPSVLIEAGFLSNHVDEAFLAQDKNQDYIAAAIFRAFKQYKADLEGTAYVSDESDLKDTLKYDPKQFEVKDTVKVKPNNNGNVNNNNNSNDKPAGIVYRIQIKTSETKISLTSKSFSGLKNVYEYNDKGKFKYTAGEYKSLKEANAYLKELKGKGYPDAFVVAFNNDKRISIEEAKKLLGGN